MPLPTPAYRTAVIERQPYVPVFIGATLVPAATGTGFSVTPHANSRLGDDFLVFIAKKNAAAVTVPASFSGTITAVFNTSAADLQCKLSNLDIEPAALAFSWTGSVDYVAACLTYRRFLHTTRDVQGTLTNQNSANLALASPLVTTRPRNTVIGAAASLNLRTFTPPYYATERVDTGGAGGPSLTVWDYVSGYVGSQPNDNTVLSSSDLSASMAFAMYPPRELRMF